MKVLHVQRAGGVSGSERHLLTLLPGLQALGIDVGMVVLEAPGGEQFTAAMGEAGVEAQGIGTGRWPSPRTLLALRDAVRSSGADVLHSHLIHADVLSAVVGVTTKVVHVSTVHSTAIHYRREPGRTLAAAAGRSARVTIAISEHVGRFLVARKIVPPDRVKVIHYGIDVTGWPATPPTDRGDEVVVLLASRLVPDKGHDVALRALAGIADQVPGLRFTIAGDGPLRDELEALAASLGIAARVDFRGYVADIGAEMAAADIVMFPTGEGFGEGFGLVNIEAMAAARPLVASAVASMPEIIEDGATGLLVPPDDVEGFARALLELIADPEKRRRFGVAGRRRVEEHFSLHAMVGATAATYAEVLRSG